MQCTYCHAWNEEDASRCARCGRRALTATRKSEISAEHSAEPSANPRSSYPFMTAMSLALDMQPEVAPPLPQPPPSPPRPAAEFPRQAFSQASSQAPVNQTPQVADTPQSPAFAPTTDFSQPPASGAGTQPWLFRAGEFGRPKVVPIPVLTPRQEPLPRRRRMAETRTARPQTGREAGREGLQHLLDLQDAAAMESSAFDAVIDCDAPVAPTAQRLAAALFDGAVVLLSVAIFFTLFALAGGSIGLDQSTLLLGTTVTLIFGLLYRVFWWLGDGDTPGTSAAGMRVINFDGRRPDRKQRGRRLAAGGLSLLSAGLGLLWVLVDEESLSWHDHISKTFPTSI